jgi:hypothetical protein
MVRASSERTVVAKYSCAKLEDFRKAKTPPFQYRSPDTRIPDSSCFNVAEPIIARRSDLNPSASTELVSVAERAIKLQRVEKPQPACGLPAKPTFQSSAEAERWQAPDGKVTTAPLPPGVGFPRLVPSFPSVWGNGRL